MNAPEQTTAANIYHALVRALNSIEGAAKNASNPHYKSKFADLPSVIAAIKPHLAANGLAFIQPTKPHEKGVEVETIVIHESGGQVHLGSLFVPATKNDAQGFGSANTYARRYALQTAFGLPVYDDDGELAAQSRPEPKVSQTLIDLREASMNGTNALREAFEKHKSSPGFDELWERNKTALRTAASAADQEQQ